MNIFNTRMEEGSVKETFERENLSLKSRLAQLEAQAKKYFHLKLQKDIMDKKISKLQMEMVLKQKSIRKLKSKTTKFRKDMFNKSSYLEKMEHHVKKIWSLLLVFGNKLGKNDLLTMEEKDKLRIEYEEWFTLLVSQDKGKTEEIFNILNDLPISLFEVLNDSVSCSEVYSLAHNQAYLNKKQDAVPASSTPEDNISITSANQEKNDHSLQGELDKKPHTTSSSTPYKSLGMVPINLFSPDAFSRSPVSSESEDTFVTTCDYSILSNNSNNITAESVAAGDSENETDVLNHKSLKLHINDCDMNRICKDEPEKSLIEFRSDQSNYDLSHNLVEHSHTASCNISGSQPITHTVHVTHKSGNQESSKHTAILPSINLTDSTSQMSSTESIHTICANEQCNLNISDGISKNKRVIPENSVVTSNCHSTNSTFHSREIADETVIVKNDKNPSKKTHIQLSKGKFRRMDIGHVSGRHKKKNLLPPPRVNHSKLSFNQSYTSPRKGKSLGLHFISLSNDQSKVSTLMQNNSGIKEHSKNKRTTILLPGPSIKVSGITKQCLVKEKSPLQQNLFTTTYIKRIRPFRACSFQPKKKPKTFPNIESFDMAPVRVKGRTLTNKGTLTKEGIEVVCNDDINEHNEELSKVSQIVNSETEFMEDETIQHCDFDLTNKPKKIRKEHKRNLQKVNFNTNETNMAYYDKKEITVTDANISQKLENTSGNDINELLKQAELSIPKKNVKLQNTFVFKQLKLGTKHKNLTFNNISKYARYRKYASKIQKQKSKVDVKSINKSHCTQKVKLLKAKKEFKCHTKGPCDKTKDNKSNENKSLRNKLPVVISENETQMHVNSQQIIVPEQSSETSPENKDSVPLSCRYAIKENTFIECEIPTSFEEVDMPSTEGEEIQFSIKCNSHAEDTNSLVVAKDLDVGVKLLNSEENCISENDSDFEGDLVIDYGFDDDKCLITSTTDNDSVKEITMGSSSIKEGFASSGSIPPTTSLQSFEKVVEVECKPQMGKCVNEQQRGFSVYNNGDSTCSDSTFTMDTSLNSESASNGLNPKIQIIEIEKDFKVKTCSKLTSKSKSKKISTNKTKKVKDKFEKKPKETTILSYGKFWQEFQKIQFTEENFHRNVKKLLNFLINPSKFSNNSELLLDVLNYLVTSKKDILLEYSVSEDLSVLFPSDENCIITTLFQIESKKKLHLYGLLETSLTKINHLIISEKKLNIFGLASLCRVFTAICKEKGDSLKPITLCGDLLKRKHHYAPYLIASVVGVWRELFHIDNNVPAEKVLFYSCILYGASKRPKTMLESYWENSSKIISKFCTAVPVHNARSAVHMLKGWIQQKCQEDSWNSMYLSSALIILSTYEDWDWTKENLLTDYILPNLTKYGRETLNENAFELFCNMYVDACLLSPGNPLDTILRQFFCSSSYQDGNFVRDCAAAALVRFVYLKNRKLPLFLKPWFEQHKENPKIKLIGSHF